MITKKYKFTIETKKLGSEYSQDISIDFDDNATQEEVETAVNDQYIRWLSCVNYGGWVEL